MWVGISHVSLDITASNDENDFNRANYAEING